MTKSCDFNTIIEQIKKELKYSKLKYPCQELDVTNGIRIAVHKLYDNMTCGCLGWSCNNKQKSICNCFAAIAILIKTIHQNCSKEDLEVRNEHIDRLTLDLLFNKEDDNVLL